MSIRFIWGQQILCFLRFLTQTCCLSRAHVVFKATTSHLGIDGVKLKNSLAQKKNSDGRNIFLNTRCPACESAIIQSGSDDSSANWPADKHCMSQTYHPGSLWPMGKMTYWSAIVAPQDSQQMFHWKEPFCCEMFRQKHTWREHHFYELQ